MNTNNTLFIPRPSTQTANAVACGGCSSIGLTDPLGVTLGPRRNREKVREQIKDYVMLMLGAPAIKLELDEQQLDAAVDLALQTFEEYAPAEYCQWTTIYTTPGQSVYKLPDDVGFVREVAYKETANYAFSASDLGGVIPLEYMGAGAYGSIAGGINPQQPVWGKMGEWVLYKQYESMYNRVSGQEGGWEWLGGFNHIKLYPVPYRVYPVGIRYVQRRPDFTQVTESMREGALAYARIMLGEIRTRIMNPPGPNGGVQLNGERMVQQGKEEKEKWEERLITRFGDILPIRMG